MPEFFGENQGWEGKKSHWNPSVKWPRFTKEGFKKVKIPDDMYKDIMDHYSRCNFEEEINDDRGFDEDYGEYVVGGSIAIRFARKPEDVYYMRSTLPHDLIQKWSKQLQPLMEEWSGVELEFSAGYGIREYIPNSVLGIHRDMAQTHVISVIIFIDESPEGTKWPLEFVDHDKNIHRVTFEKGDMLLYESLCPHSRNTPFLGKFYRNMYFHWRPVDWDSTAYLGQKCKYSCMQEVLDEEIEQ